MSENIQDQMRAGYHRAADVTTSSVRAWNELVATSTDMAFDMVLKNWNYSQTLRDSVEQAVEQPLKTQRAVTEQAVEDVVKMQRTMTKEMLQFWQGVTENVVNSAK